jgi:hypothetical protein
VLLVNPYVLYQIVHLFNRKKDKNLYHPTESETKLLRHGWMEMLRKTNQKKGTLSENKVRSFQSLSVAIIKTFFLF